MSQLRTRRRRSAPTHFMAGADRDPHLDPSPAGLLAATLSRFAVGSAPCLLGMRVDSIADGTVVLSMNILPSHLAPNGFLHAASVVAFADTAAGYGCVVHLPEGASGFTTIELRSNLLGTTLDGIVSATANLIHSGRATQVRDAVVDAADGRRLALFRCTRMILWPKTWATAVSARCREAGESRQEACIGGSCHR